MSYYLYILSYFGSKMGDIFWTQEPATVFINGNWIFHLQIST